MGYANEHAPANQALLLSNRLLCFPHNSPPNFADIPCFLIHSLSCTTTLINRTFFTSPRSHSYPCLFEITSTQ